MASDQTEPGEATRVVQHADAQQPATAAENETTPATANSYAATADALTQRIAALGPQILELESPWDLFRIDGFACDDLAPSLFQASFALAKAKAIVQQQRAREVSHGR